MSSSVAAAAASRPAVRPRQSGRGGGVAGAGAEHSYGGELLIHWKVAGRRELHEGAGWKSRRLSTSDTLVASAGSTPFLWATRVQGRLTPNRNGPVSMLTVEGKGRPTSYGSEIILQIGS